MKVEVHEGGYGKKKKVEVERSPENPNNSMPSCCLSYPRFQMYTHVIFQMISTCL